MARTFTCDAINRGFRTPPPLFQERAYAFQLLRIPLKDEAQRHRALQLPARPSRATSGISALAAAAAARQHLHLVQGLPWRTAARGRRSRRSRDPSYLIP
jgi:hypothetical protein